MLKIALIALTKAIVVALFGLVTAWLEQRRNRPPQQQ